MSAAEQSVEYDALRQIVLAYAEPVTSPGRDSLTETVERLAEHVEKVVADRFAAVEWYTGKVPGYLAESHAAAVLHDDCPTASEYEVDRG